MSTNSPSPPASRFKLRIQVSPESTTVICSGRLTSDIAAEFKKEVRDLIPNTKRLILDLGDVGFIDSSGLGAIVGVYITARKSTCEMQLANLSKKVRDLMGMANVLSVFESTSNFGTRLL